MKKQLAVLLLMLSFGGCQTAENIVDTSNNTLNSTLWMQHAAEYEALALQGYNAAAQMLPMALEDDSWTAALEQGEDFSDLPPAIILDLDETAIDNSFYEARVILDNTSFQPDTWNEWVREKQADAIEGAVNFTNRAADMGIALFYITNRDFEVESETIENLIVLGFPVEEGHIMSNGGQPNWTSEKVERRKEVASGHRVVMIFGDDLNDFAPARNISMEERRQLVHEHAEKWSIKWFVFPNPNYGSWERALYTGEESTEVDRQDRRLQLLEDKRE